MIANYTTTVPVRRSLAEVQDMLADAGASAVAVTYDGGRPVAVMFELDGRGYRLPSRIHGVHHVLQQAKGVKAAQRTYEHAERVAWRIVRDWTRAQTAIVQAGVVQAQEVFLPYLVTARSSSGKVRTLYHDWAASNDARQLEES